MRRLLLIVLMMTAATCKAPAVPGRVAFVGDSLTFQAIYHGARFASPAWDTEEKVGIGWQAENAQPRVTQDVANPLASPEILGIALGHNDAAGSFNRDGFTQEDRDQLATLALSPADDTCTFFVLPTVQPGAPPDHEALIEQYRIWAVDFVRQHAERMVYVDWRVTVQVHPEYVVSDGVHLNTELPEALAAYEAIAQQGVDSCRTLVADGSGALPSRSEL